MSRYWFSIYDKWLIINPCAMGRRIIIVPIYLANPTTVLLAISSSTDIFTQHFPVHIHDGIIAWTHSPHIWLFVRQCRNYRWFPLRKASNAEFSFLILYIYLNIIWWTNNRVVEDLYPSGVTVMLVPDHNSLIMMMTSLSQLECFGLFVSSQ